MNVPTFRATKSQLVHIEMQIAVILFGVSGLFGKLLSASPALIVFGRSAFAAIAILIGLRLLPGDFKNPPRQSLPLLFLSGLLLALHWLTFFHSIQISTVAIGVVGFATFPVFVTFLEPIVSRRKIRGIDILSAAIVVVGLLFVAPNFHLGDQGTRGLLWAIASGAIYAVLALLHRHLVARNSFVVVTFFQQSIIALVMLPVVFIVAQPPSLHTLWLLIALGVFCTAVPQLLYIKSLRVIKAQLASVMISMEPVYAMVLAAIFLNEIPSLSVMFGAALILGAVVLATRAHSQSSFEIQKGG